jgi:hypothetical protein
VASADPAECDFVGDSSDIVNESGIQVRETSHSCRWSSGSQSLDRYDVWVNMSGPVGRHNATYKTETDTGGGAPYWCYGMQQCTETYVVVDGTGTAWRYSENGDASYCNYQWQTVRPSGRAVVTSPRHDACFDYLTLMP